MAGRNGALKWVGVAVVIGLGWWAIEGQDGPFAWAAAEFKRVTAAPQAMVLAASQPGHAEGTNASGSASAPAVNPRVAASAAALTTSRYAAQEVQLGLTRQLGGEQTVTYGGRDRTVLGTKEVVNAAEAPQTVLLVRDEESGQVDYWQPGLRIELKPGNDYSAFMAERAGLTRRFANSQYADVGVDAADIAKVHAELKADPRVTRVEFLPIQVPPKAR